MKAIKVTDLITGELIVDKEITGDFQIQYNQKTDGGYICHIGRIENGKFDDKHWIKNYYYRPIAEKLIQKFEELGHIKPNSILFLENTAWEPSKTNTKKTWIARISNANIYLRETWGYSYLIETREYFMNNMSREQIIATIYHELLHIDKDYELRSHDIEDWEWMVATLGKDWAETQSQIANLLDDEFPGWSTLRRSDNQITVFDTDFSAGPDTEKIIPINRASKAVNLDD